MKTMIKTHMAALFAATAFENKAGWKLDADGKPELKDGNPVYIDASGREMVIEHGTIARLNGEAKTHREAKEAAEAKLKAFEGIDPEIARKAVDTVSKLDAKKLIDAGEVDKVRQEISGQFQTQLTEAQTKYQELESRYTNAQIDNLFAGSQFIRERVAVPPDMFAASFRNNVKIGADGKPEFLDRNGNRLMSKTRVGEYADASEAFELLVEQHPQKDAILKADNANGSGSNGNGGNRGGGNKMTRTDFEALQGNQQAEAAAKMGKGELTIVDG